VKLKRSSCKVLLLVLPLAAVRMLPHGKRLTQNGILSQRKANTVSGFSPTDSATSKVVLFQYVIGSSDKILMWQRLVLPVWRVRLDPTKAHRARKILIAILGETGWVKVEARGEWAHNLDAERLAI
jgi:hypothetical protein